MKKRILIIAAVLAVLAVAAVLLKNGLNRESQTETLLKNAKVPDTCPVEEMKAAYDSEIASFLIGHKSVLISTKVTDEEIKNATLTQSMPVLSAVSVSGANESYESKLQLTAWQAVAHVDEKPIGIFWVDASADGKMPVSDRAGENFAGAYEYAAARLDGSAKAVIEVKGYYFVADTVGNVCLVDTTGGSATLKTIDEVMAAANKVNTDGGNLLDILYPKAA